MNLSIFAGSAFFKAYGPELAPLGLEFVPVSRPFANVFPDGRWLGACTDPAATAARIRNFSDRDAAAWRALLSAFPGQAEHVFALLGSPMRKHAMARFMFLERYAPGTRAKILGQRIVPPTVLEAENPNLVGGDHRPASEAKPEGMHASGLCDASRTRGYGENHVILREALPNAVLPTLTLVGVQFTFLIGGTVIIERLFFYEGLGNMAIDAVISAGPRAFAAPQSAYTRALLDAIPLPAPDQRWGAIAG